MMKKLFENWKNYVTKEENELDVVQTSDIERAPPGSSAEVDILREYLQEIQDMGTRLIAMQEELRELRESGEISYHPGADFRHAAKKLAAADEPNSLASNVNRWIENETRLPALSRQIKSKMQE